MKKYVAFFDLDNTILKTNSGSLFFRYCYRKGQVGFGTLLKLSPMPLLYKINKLNIESFARAVVKRFQGESQKKIYDFADEWMKNMVIEYFRKSILEEIQKHKENGAITVMISASTHNVCYPIFKYLQMDELFCTDIEVEGDLFTGRLKTYCYGEEKVRKAEEFCLKNNLNITDAYFYSDSHSDLFLLNKVGHPVCVHPDKILKKIAIDKQWRIIKE